MAPQIQSSTTTTALQNSHGPSSLWQNRYPVLIGTYFLLTSTLLFRISRAPISASRKWEQAETMFKGTTLGAVVVGIALGGGWNRRRSEMVRAEHMDVDVKEARRVVRDGGVQRD